MGKVSLNKEVFDSTIKNVTSAVSNLKGTKINDKTFKQTDLKSMKQQLEVLREFQKVLDSYIDLMEIDLEKLKTVGDEMVKQDEEIGATASLIN